MKAGAAWFVEEVDCSTGEVISREASTGGCRLSKGGDGKGGEGARERPSTNQKRGRLGPRCGPEDVGYSKVRVISKRTGREGRWITKKKQERRIVNG